MISDKTLRKLKRKSFAQLEKIKRDIEAAPVGKKWEVGTIGMMFHEGLQTRYLKTLMNKKKSN